MRKSQLVGGNTLFKVEDILRIVLALDPLEPGKVVTVVGVLPIADAAVGNINIGPGDIGLQRLAELLDPGEGSFLLTVLLPCGLPFYIELWLSMEERCGSGWYPAHCTTPVQAPYIGICIGANSQEVAYRLDSSLREKLIDPG